MKKGFIKFFITVLLTAGAAAAVFFTGWTQFAVPPGKYGVLVSKSCGYNSRVIAPNEFMWRWERLIPANSEILVFDLAPRIAEYNLSGALHNAEKYGKASPEKKDFTWSAAVKVKTKIKPSGLAAIVKDNELKTKESLLEYSGELIGKHIKDAADICIEFYTENPEKYTETDFRNKYAEELAKLSPFQTQIISLSLQEPGFREYREAKKIYEEYKNTEEKILAFKIDKLKKLQAVLSDLSGDINSSLNSLAEIINE